MIPKEAYQPAVCGEVSKIQEAPDYICHFLHEWEFSQERELRTAIRHMVEVRHEIGGTFYGGYKPDETLPGKLSISFFQKAGLLKPLIARFSGHIEKAVDFAFSEQVAGSENQNGNCRHHWMIETPHGATSPGYCKHCGAGREFRNSSDDHIWEDAPRTASSEPSAIRQLAVAGSPEFD